MVNQHWLKEELFFHLICLDLISNWHFLTGWKLNPYHIPVDHAFQRRREARREGGGVVWMFDCWVVGFFFVLAKTPTALSLNSKDLCNWVAQGAAQHWPLTRADPAVRGTWFVWMAAGWKGALTLCFIHPFQLPPKEEMSQFPMVNTRSDGSSASVCLVCGRPLMLVLPETPVWFGIRFWCWLVAVFELALYL